MINGTCDPRFKKVQDAFLKTFKTEFETGAALAVELDGELVINLWGGYQDASRTKAWQEDTLVNVFSVTKGVTATCISRLIDQGKLDPSMKVAHYWPEYGCNGKEDTKVSDLLCHRAAMFGFKDGIPEGSFQDWKKFVHRLEVQAPYSKPGSSQGYHALTFGWLTGELVRRVDGRSVGQYFKDEIAAPFGIDFHIGLPIIDHGRCADMIMMERNKIKLPGEFIKYIPNFVLPTALKNFKTALISGDFHEAFQSREEDAVNYVNSVDWRLAEIPSANGHGSAKSLAKLFGILSNGCSRDGISIMSKDVLQNAITPYSSGPDSVLFGATIKFGLGYELAQGISTIGDMSPHLSDRMFGHAGVGGAVAFGDPDKSLGYGFVCNQQHHPKVLYQSSNELTKEIYSIIS